MEIGNLIIRFLEVLVWPVTVIILMLVFRSQIAAVILRLSKLKYRDLEVEFGKELRKAEQSAQEVQLPSLQVLAQVPEPAVFTSSYDRLFDLTPSSPRAAIMEAWLRVEAAADEVARELEIQPMARRLGRAREVVVELVQQDRLPESAIKLYDSLRKMRNNAVHNIDFEINTEDAARFVELALGLAQKIRTAISQ